MVELSLIKKFEKWILSWIKIAKSLLGCIPYVKLVIRNNYNNLL